MSSTASDLKSLGDRLTECGISVCFFENTLINDFLNGCFDLLIYGSDVWNPKVTPSFDVRKVYANMLAEEIKSYLRKNRVAFYYIDIEKTPVSLDGRIEIVPVPTQPAIVVGGERVVYTVYTDSIAGDGFHTVGGRRVTVGNSAANKKRFICSDHALWREALQLRMKIRLQVFYKVILMTLIYNIM